MSIRPLVGVTLGDPVGIGPEIIARALAEQATFEGCRPLVIGSAEPLRRAIAACGLSLDLHPVDEPSAGRYEHGVIDLVDLSLPTMDLASASVQRAAGEATYAYISRAIDWLLEAKIDATASGPANKESLRRAGYKFAGVTEIFAYLTGASNVSTLLVVGPLRIFQITTHVSLRDALSLLTTERILHSIRTAHVVLSDLEGEPPRLAVAGLNPHAGENGLMGREELDIFAPAVDAARSEGIDVEGPLPADSLFGRGLRREFSGLLFPLHDQANIGVKLMADSYPPVTVAAGLPVIRTTVAHGTAFDIAFRGIADYRPMQRAILLAAELAARRMAAA